MSSSSLGSLPSKKTLQEPEPSSLLIKKPRTFLESCPVETTTERLPLIGEKPRRKELKASREPSSSSEDNWLKPGVSLPKLLSKKVSRSSRPRREEVSNPVRAADFSSVIGLDGLNSAADRSRKHVVSKSLKCYKDLEESAVDKGAPVPPETVGPSACELLFRVPSSELTFDDFKAEKEVVEESHALQRWEYWLKEHKKQQAALSKRLGRKKCELQFQKAQNYRMILEDKSLFIRAQIPVADKWRGHPFLWRSAVKIGGSDKKLKEEEEDTPEYYGVKTKMEKGEVSDMEFIGIPMSIKKEKGILCESSVTNVDMGPFRDRSKYREDRLRDYEDQAKILKPHEIQMDELEVVGKKIPQETENKVAAPVWPENLPKIQVIPAQGDDSCPRDSYGDGSGVFCLSIGGEELQYELGNENCQRARKGTFELKWEIDFGVNAVGMLVERTLRVENKGTTAVEYEFLPLKAEKAQSLSSLQPVRHEPWFFFNKNPGIFLPGQIYNLKFYHFAKRMGVRKETWRLKTSPPLSRNGDPGTVVFWAMSTDDSLDSDIKALDSYLRSQVTRSVVAFILQVLLWKTLNPVEDLRGIEYRSLFFEKELFEYQNPKHYYHSIVVREYHKFFEQIPQKRQPEWDLSLNSLIKLIVTYVTHKERDFLLRQTAEHAKKLFRPNRLLVSNMKKYRMTYEILCKMTNFMEEDYEYLKSCLVQRKEEVKRLPSEYGEVEEAYSGSSLKSEEKEMGELGTNVSEVVYEIRPINFLYFQMMFYLKVYRRVGEAVENMVGALETSKLFEPWKEVDHRLTRPSREGRE